MTEDNSRDRILRAVKQRVKESNEHERVSLVTDAIGDRRERDLVDILAQVEQDYGWSTALDYLVKARSQKYTSPMTLGKTKSNLEELKYREEVFSLLSCTGLEPVPIDTTTLLKELYSENSLVDASRVFLNNLENLVVDQITNGDTLFFNLSENTSISQHTLDMLQENRIKNIRNISIERNRTKIDVKALWHCEYGRLALAKLGVKNSIIDSDTLNLVLSVIQEKPTLESSTIPSSLDKEDILSRPSNKDYQKLLSNIMHQDVDELSHLGSKHAVPTLNTLLDDVSSGYKDAPSTDGFKQILKCINAHIAVRSLDSVIALEKASRMKDSRITTTVILSIGNFYHESAVSTLVDILCKSKNRGIIETTTQSIMNLYKKCPEADFVINNRLDEECTNRGKLVKLQKLLRKGRQMYYQ